MVLESPEKDWLALSLVAGVGTQTLQKLSETFGGLSQIWQKSSDQLQQLGLRKDVIERLPKAMEVRSFQMEKRLIESSPIFDCFAQKVRDSQLIYYRFIVFPQYFMSMVSYPMHTIYVWESWDQGPVPVTEESKPKDW